MAGSHQNHELNKGFEGARTKPTPSMMTHQGHGVMGGRCKLSPSMTCRYAGFPENTNGEVRRFGALFYLIRWSEIWQNSNTLEEIAGSLRTQDNTPTFPSSTTLTRPVTPLEPFFIHYSFSKPD